MNGIANNEYFSYPIRGGRHPGRQRRKEDMTHARKNMKLRALGDKETYPSIVIPAQAMRTILERRMSQRKILRVGEAAREEDGAQHTHPHNLFLPLQNPPIPRTHPSAIQPQPYTSPSQARARRCQFRPGALRSH